MTLWVDTNNVLHDDMDGTALDLPAWPTGLTIATQAQIDAIQNPPPTLSQAQAVQTALMYVGYNTDLTKSVTITTAGGVTQTFQADLNSQDLLSRATQGYKDAGTVPAGFYWVAEDNTQVPFTLPDLQTLYSAMLSQGWTAFQKLQTRKESIRAATSVASVQAIVW